MHRRFLFWIIGAGCLALAPSSTAEDEAAFARARQQMVEHQLKTRDITDARVLWAMGRVPRHRFVRPTLAGEAYADRPLPIDEGQTISQPYIVALMTQLLELRGPGSRPGGTRKAGLHDRDPARAGGERQGSTQGPRVHQRGSQSGRRISGVAGPRPL